MVSAGVAGSVREDELFHVMSEDGDSGILRREPYDNGSNVAVGIFKHMLVDPGGPAPMLRLSMPPTPRYVYPVRVICKERQNCIWVMFVPRIP